MNSSNNNGSVPSTVARVPSRWQLGIKRALDIGVAAVMLFLLAPVLAILALVIRCALGSPVLFRQQRPGLGGKAFTIYKFRTMRESRNADGILLSDEQRLTWLGSLVRRTSMDELPELYNVLRGDMSLVGPRPLLVEYLDRYSPEQRRRHEVRPGVTGWAQINGRNAIGWDEKFALDVWYVDHWSIWLDVTILVLSVPAICLGKGVSKPGHATTDFFEPVSGRNVK